MVLCAVESVTEIVIDRINPEHSVLSDSSTALRSAGNNKKRTFQLGPELRKAGDTSIAVSMTVKGFYCRQQTNLVGSDDMVIILRVQVGIRKSS